MIGPSRAPVAAETDNGNGSVPATPYSSNRALIRNLTLPSVPNFDIPPSPPGSPLPGSDKKFTHFLELKKQGIRFNEKLARSSALKNPSLLQKLMNFAGLEDQDQYTTTLSTELWDPAAFPLSAFKDELAKNQQEITRLKEAEKSRTQRENIDFVSATDSCQSSRGGTPGVKGLKGSVAERVMAGLNRDKPRSPQVVEGGIRANLSHRGGKHGGGSEGLSSRSPKRRKRSRSR